MTLSPLDKMNFLYNKYIIYPGYANLNILQCEKCSVGKPYHYFDNYGFCAACQYEIYYKENKKKISDQKKIYNKANKKKISDQKKIYYKANTDKIIKHVKKYSEEKKRKMSELNELDESTLLKKPLNAIIIKY